MGALAGTVTEGKGLNIGYFAQQELDVLHPARTCWSGDRAAWRATSVRNRASAAPNRTARASWAASISAATWSYSPWAP